MGDCDALLRVWRESHPLCIEGATPGRCNKCRMTDTYLASPTMSAEEVVLSEKFMAQMRKNYSIDKNGDPVGAQPDAGWETGYAAGIRCFYRILRDIYAAASPENREGK